MKFKYINILLLSSIAVLGSCSKEDKQQQGLPGGEEVVLSIADTDIPPLGGERKMAFTSNSKWTMSVDYKSGVGTDVSWVKLDKSSGNAGTTVVKLTVTKNDTWQDREAVVSFKDASGNTKSIIVSQDCPYLIITDEDGTQWGYPSVKEKTTTRISRKDDDRKGHQHVDDVVEIKWYDSSDHTEGEARTYTVESNIDWKVDLVNPDDHFETEGLLINGERLYSSKSFKGDSELRIQPVSQNVDFSQHNVSVRISALDDQHEWAVLTPSDGLNQYDITFNQDYLIFVIGGSAHDDVTRTFSDLTPEYEKKAMDTIGVFSEVDWKLNKKPSWLGFYDEEGKSVSSGKANDVSSLENFSTFTLKTLSCNPSRNERKSDTSSKKKDQWTDVLDFYSEKANVHRYVQISQDGYLMELKDKDDVVTNFVSNPLAYSNAGSVNGVPEQMIVKVNTHGPWSFKNLPTWVHVKNVQVTGAPSEYPNKTYSFKYGDKSYSDSTFVGAATVTMEAYPDEFPKNKRQNPDFSKKSGTFQVKSTKSTAVYSEVKSTQEPFVFDIKDVKSATQKESDISNLNNLLYADNDNHTINLVTVSGEWDAKIVDASGNPVSWIKLNKSTGVDTAQQASIVAKLQDANTSFDVAREANIIFTSRRHLNKYGDSRPAKADVTIPVKQFPFALQITVKETMDGNTESLDPDKTEAINVPAYKKTKPRISVTVKYSPGATAPEVTYPSFFDIPGKNLVKARGPESTTQTFDVQEILNNPTTAERSGDIKITAYYRTSASAEKKVEKTLRVIQDPFSCNLDKTAKDVTGIDPVNNIKAETVEFDATSEVGWTAEPNSSWLKLNQKSGTVPSSSGITTGNVKIVITPEKNPTKSERKSSVTIKVGDGYVTGYQKIVNFTQNPYVFDDSQVTLNFSELGKDASGAVETHTFDVTSSGPWSIKNIPSGITVTPTSGTGNGTVTVKVSPNYTGAALENKFTVRANILDDTTLSEKGVESELSKLITVKQAAYKWSVDGEGKTFKTIDNSSAEFSIVCSGDWTATKSATANWLKLSSSTGKGDQSGKPQTVTITVDNNTTADSRSVTVTFAAKNTSFTKKVTFTQNAYSFEVIDGKLTAFAASGAAPQSIPVTVSEGGKWHVEKVSDASGMIESVSPSFGDATSDSGAVTIKVTDNTAKTARTAKIKVVSNDNSSFFKEITLNQNAAAK